MKVSPKVPAAVLALCAPLVAYYEGYVPNSYADPIGIPTACYGHTGPEVRLGQRYTRAECEALLAGDLAAANTIVHRCITVAMLPHQEAALTSFAYNVGAGRKGVKDGLCELRNGRQPYIRRMANAGQWAQACAGLMDWTSANGIKLRGLVKRRAAERAMCEGRV